MRKMSLVEHLDRLELIKDTGCLVVPKSKSMSVRQDGKLVSLTRVVYEEHIGALPHRVRIIRACKNPRCLNSDHMLLSSPWDKFLGFVFFHAVGGCWRWTGAKDGGGYGVYRSPNLSDDKAHRLSWIHYYGEIPEGMHVCHHCDTPSCINPGHLFLGTNQDNVNDKMAKGNHFPMKGRLNGRCKLKEQDVINIRKSNEDGISYKKLSKMYNLSMTQIGRIVRKESWSWL